MPWFGSGTYGDVCYADVVDAGLVPTLINISASAGMTANPVNSIEAVLTDQKADLVFSAEIHPWVLSER